MAKGLQLALEQPSELAKVPAALIRAMTENDTPQNVHDAVNSIRIGGNVEKATKAQPTNSPNNTRAAPTKRREADVVDLTIDDDEESPKANRSSSGFVEGRLAAAAVKDAKDVQRAVSLGEQRQEH